MRGPERGLGAVGQAPPLGLTLTRAHEEINRALGRAVVGELEPEESPNTESGVLACVLGEKVWRPLVSLEMGQPQRKHISGVGVGVGKNQPLENQRWLVPGRGDGREEVKERGPLEPPFGTLLPGLDLRVPHLPFLTWKMAASAAPGASVGEVCPAAVTNKQQEEESGRGTTRERDCESSGPAPGTGPSGSQAWSPYGLWDCPEAHPWDSTGSGSASHEDRPAPSTLRTLSVGTVPRTLQAVHPSEAATPPSVDLRPSQAEPTATCPPHWEAPGAPFQPLPEDTKPRP